MITQKSVETANLVPGDIVSFDYPSEGVTSVRVGSVDHVSSTLIIYDFNRDDYRSFSLSKISGLTLYNFVPNPPKKVNLCTHILRWLGW